MPRHYQADYLAENVFYVCRQTVANWIDYLIKADYYAISDTECKYYVIKHSEDGKKVLTETTKETYCAGWKKYWQFRGEQPKEASGYAWKAAMEVWGGCAYKHRPPQENAIYLNQIYELIDIVNNCVSSNFLLGKFE